MSGKNKREIEDRLKKHMEDVGGVSSWKDYEHSQMEVYIVSFLKSELERINMGGWILTTEQMPSVYLSGAWDGKKSDQVLAEGVSGKQYLATYYEGVLDGSKIKEWYASNDFEITEPIVRFLEIPG